MDRSISDFLKGRFVKKNALQSTMRLFLLLAFFSLSACSRSASAKLNYPIGSVWNVPVTGDSANWDAASVLAQEQHTGFLLANEEADFNVYTFGEGNQKDDVQTAVRSMVEGQTEGADEAVAAILGATSNEATTRTVALANFFNVPMIVPGASGDNLLSDTNLWAFQLSASNSAYANHLLNTVLNKQIVYEGYEEGFEPEFRIAILYEQNTYGETAAVSMATAAMAQSYSIVLYDKFPAETPSPARLRALVNLALDKDAHMVVMISSNPAVAQTLTETFSELAPAPVRPLLVGVASGFTSQQFMSSPLIESTYVLRQQMDAAACPAEIESLYAAQNYAAVKLLAAAVEEVGTSASLDEKKVAISTEDEKLVLYREALRDALKEIDLELPCLGRVAFDNGGQNKFLSLEIVTTESGTKRVFLPQEFVDLVRSKIDLSSTE
jgi:ABC-type branched-subunit amino acid transport system substrate-binding protein